MVGVDPTESVRPVTAATPVDLERVAVIVAELAADHVRGRRTELFSTFGSEPSATAGPGGAVATKSTPTDPVTLADTESENLIRERLRALRPDDDVLGEERGGSVEVPDGVRWVVDPIDGTVNYLYGIPAYAVSVAAQIGGESVAGAVVDVAGGVTYSAARGHGAYAWGSGDRSASERLSCARVTDLGLALVASGFAYDRGRRRAQGELVGKLLPHIRDIRRVGAAALDLCMVASGRVDAHFEHGLSPWDWAAGGLIAAEAGAVVRLPAADSRAADGEPTIAAAPGIAEDFLGLVGELGGLRAIPEGDQQDCL
ncbi:inositol monophosphatase [Gordonia pseudamarae]|jgi:myo-inositol-1(or 4)-monophosphatase|uniref:Inositol-1-monophosphatase n=1 Tax=Gordonia pseudamarae TaxID=2831662 RepID=A0ABX6IH52_9ACTN|nr:MULTISPECIES: inositol monophosphatase family protein [Gordonia]MBD0020889.1 inositol monophosphatase [Gordonia sp. (in: high G+C Gram-positive bacteria)]QHN26247.1 inositol monophosphatase [Gordonia pseudamarae]QHN35139.1 inositol monophosphatase [Gordonia pseudamarae]